MNSTNTNLIALRTTNTLSSHYWRLATSVEKLSSGLRINSAADDAAGLAIRELMRTDIAALNQGKRNASDAISMIQVADAALGVIDEKLVRMKELAEQAATGTYSSAQRLMIDSEFQAMGGEINRIARATDFNGIKLLDYGANLPTSPPPTNYDVTYSESVTSNGPTNIFPLLSPNSVLPGIANPQALGVGSHTIRLQYASMDAQGNPEYTVTSNPPINGISAVAGYDRASLYVTVRVELGNGNFISNRYRLGRDNPPDLAAIEYQIDIVDPNAQPADPDAPAEIPDDVVKIHFGTGNDSAEDYYYIRKHNATLTGLGLSGTSLIRRQKHKMHWLLLKMQLLKKTKFGVNTERLKTVWKIPSPT